MSLHMHTTKSSPMLESLENHIRKEKSDIPIIHKAAIFVVIIMLTYDYFNTNPQVKVLVEKPKFSLLGPRDTTRVPTNDVYNKLINIKNFTFKVNPQPCKSYSQGLLLIVIVSSNPVNSNRRMAIRNTWGKVADSMQLVFLIGEIDNVTLSHEINNEITKFGDIVQGNFVDAYRNMTYKHVMGLKWVTHHCPTAKYILKTDDDVLVHIDALRHFLARELSPWGARDLISCQVLYHAYVQRSESKWQVTPEEYAMQYYPTYCAGWAILYSQDVVPRLLEAAQGAPYFWIDDVQITGVAAEHIKVARTSWKDLVLSSHRTNLLIKMGPKYVGQFLFAPPELTASMILKIWKALAG